jgi:hypothetical protein
MWQLAAALGVQARRQILQERAFSVQFQLRILELKKLDRLEIISSLPVLTRLQAFD